MKKYFKWLSLLCAAMLVLPIFTSCEEYDDDDDWSQGGDSSQKETPYLSPSSSVNCPAEGASYQIQIVNYKSGVSVSSAASWCNVSNDSHYAYITVKSNNSSSRRSCYVMLKYNGNTVSSVYINQAGYSDNGDNTNGGNTGGGDNGGNTGGGNTGGDNTGGGNTTTKPSAPTGVSAYSSGNSAYPLVTINWNYVSGATSYEVYRSTSSKGSYSKITTCSYTSASDDNVKIGSTYYYKVKAKNSAGTSDYSDYAIVTLEDTRTPGPVTYGNCTVSGSIITLRWSPSSHSTYGSVKYYIFRVYDPSSDEWIEDKLSASTTSKSFDYTLFVDSYGLVKCGVLAYNDNGTGGGQAKIYDTKNGRWWN